MAQYSFAQFKREAKNYTFEQVYNSWFGGELPETSPLKGLKRKIIKQQTNAFQFEGGSWLEFPPAKCIRFTFAKSELAGFIIDLENTGEFKNVMKYRLEKIDNF